MLLVLIIDKLLEIKAGAQEVWDSSLKKSRSLWLLPAFGVGTPVIE